MITASALTACTSSTEETIHLRFLHTSDVHGHVLDSLSRIGAYATLCRQQMGEESIVMTDGGDDLQGHPAAYFYNFVDTASRHIVAETMNCVGYDVATIGNHDVEAGRSVFDRWISQCDFPVLGANIIDKQTGEPYLKPYEVIERQGVKIAVLGLITPAIPNWVPEMLWEGLRFDGMLTTAQRWVPVIKKREKPDLIVGLFHSGVDETAGIHADDYCENEARLVAQQVEGFDLILYGHDHRRNMEYVLTPSGDSILAIGPTSTGACLCQVDIELKKNRRGRIVEKTVEGKLLSAKDMDEALQGSESEGFNAFASDAWFPEAKEKVEAYMNEEVGLFASTVHERDAFFGPSAFMDLIHDLQLELSDGAEISFAAPLSFDATIEKGMTHVTDMFALYKYENLLYTMRLSGREIHDFLEMSYDLWCNTMTSPADHIMLMDSVLDGGRRLGLKNMAFNFDSAAGINYTVDASKPDGQKVNILSMEDGTPFDEGKEYRVAINSYRGNGGGELLTRGAGIPLQELPSRIVASTDHDLRYHLIQTIRRKGTIAPRTRSNWRFLPDDWAPAALARDRKILFPKDY
ncbi:MAG: 5'-nucleotidase C-terminal domain-containing protein [Bacteroidaceae bacterium]|nr:5'-nucleotidase C-terminal domain-containing protein [Bacteroidaceae bacterium]